MWVDTHRMLADCLTKTGVDTTPLLNAIRNCSLAGVNCAGTGIT